MWYYDRVKFSHLESTANANIIKLKRYLLHNVETGRSLITEKNVYHVCNFYIKTEPFDCKALP
jgi:hypothetical protein